MNTDMKEQKLPLGSMEYDANPLVRPVPALKALSIRQPWAWLIVNGYKDIENRTWRTEFRGRFLIHASGGMTWDEYEECKGFVAGMRMKLPHAWQDLRWFPERGELERGGIVGEAELVDCVAGDRSPWFVGPWGFVVEGARKVPFQSCSGTLQFFEPSKVAGIKQAKLRLE